MYITPFPVESKARHGTHGARDSKVRFGAHFESSRQGTLQVQLCNHLKHDHDAKFTSTNDLLFGRIRKSFHGLGIRIHMSVATVLALR